MMTFLDPMVTGDLDIVQYKSSLAVYEFLANTKRGKMDSSNIDSYPITGGTVSNNWITHDNIYSKLCYCYGSIVVVCACFVSNPFRLYAVYFLLLYKLRYNYRVFFCRRRDRWPMRKLCMWNGRMAPSICTMTTCIRSVHHHPYHRYRYRYRYHQQHPKAPREANAKGHRLRKPRIPNNHLLRKPRPPTDVNHSTLDRVLDDSGVGYCVGNPIANAQYTCCVGAA